MTSTKYSTFFLSFFFLHQIFHSSHSHPSVGIRRSHHIVLLHLRSEDRNDLLRLAELSASLPSLVHATRLLLLAHRSLYRSFSLPFTPPSPPTASSHSQTSAETAGPSHTSTSAATLPGPTSYRILCIPRTPPSIRTSTLHLRGSDPPRAANRSSSPPAEPLFPAGIGNTIA